MDVYVSVIIPTYNRVEWVKQALDSVCRQTYSKWEALVVDDGSSDETKKELADYRQREPRIRVLARNRLPKGAPTCRNIGLAAARGDYVVFLDSDDLLAANCLDHRVAAMQANPGQDFMVFQGQLFNQVPGDSRSFWNTASDESDLCRFLRGDSVWQTTGPIWKKTALEQLHGFDEQLVGWQDVDIHLCALGRRLNYIKKLATVPDYFIRRHNSGSISQGGFKSREAIGSVFRVFEKAADILGHEPGDETRCALRQMLAYSFQLALDNRCFDLAREGMNAGKRLRLLCSHQQTIWQAAFACYAIHAKGFRGCARLGKRLLQPFQPPLRRSH